jgi:predicted aminopeptidase
VKNAVIAAALMLASGCLMPRYLAQASYGQFDLLNRARPIDQVIADPNTPPWVAELLAEIPSIKAYGAAQGLAVKRNYTTYSRLGRTAAVWFVGAADPLHFRPRKWCFPIVGCFPGLGWFDEDDAIAHRRQLEAQGYDAISRPASAYSTGGWFPDPVLSSMLSGDTDGFPEFANVILHESVHATILVADQPFFNESIASYVADAMTDQWVIDRFGDGSPQQLAWLYGQAARDVRTARMFATYAELDALYKSTKSNTDKLEAKRLIIDELVDEMRLRRRPNNASLIELRVYQAGATGLAEAHRGCGDLRHMVLAAKQLTRSDFGKDLQDDLSSVMPVIIKRCKSIQ